MVSTPVTRDEIDVAARKRAARVRAPDILDRVADLGDQFELAATVEQRLPA